MELPFQHLNLTRNPFGAFDAEERAELAVVDVDEYVEWLETPGRVLELRGAHGRGKSTHLQAMDRRMPDAHYLRVGEEPDLLDIDDHPVLLVDEGQFLTRRSSNRLFSDDRSYAVSTHRSLGGAYQRAGLAWRIAEIGGVEAETLSEIIRRRVEASRRSSGPLPEVTSEAVELLVACHGDDIRTIFDELYALFQRLEDVRSIGEDDFN